MSRRGQRKLKKDQNYEGSRWELEKEVKKLEPTIFLRYTSVYCTYKIFQGTKICRFCCKLAEHKILIFEKKQWLKETIYSICKN